MELEKLSNFKDIFNDENFYFISDIQKINLIFNIVSIDYFQKSEKELLKTIIEKYKTNFQSFYYRYYSKERIKNMENILLKIEEIFTNLLANIDLTNNELNKNKVSKHYLKKFVRDLKYYLKLFLKEIRKSFKPENVSKTNIAKNQYIRFILNKKEGLGKKFLFNNYGPNSFVEKLFSLNMSELIVACKLLNNYKIKARNFKQFIDLGQKKDPVRILLRKSGFKYEVDYLFKLSEHDDYENRLNSNKEIKFRAA